MYIIYLVICIFFVKVSVHNAKERTQITFAAKLLFFCSTFVQDISVLSAVDMFPPNLSSLKLITTANMLSKVSTSPASLIPATSRVFRQMNLITTFWRNN